MITLSRTISVPPWTMARHDAVAIEAVRGEMPIVTVVFSLCTAKWRWLPAALRIAAAFALIHLSSVTRVGAQSTNASLTGRITDSSKAVVTDAKVIVINTGTTSRTCPLELIASRLKSWDSRS
jgi:hypothetical protein